MICNFITNLTCCNGKDPVRNYTVVHDFNGHEFNGKHGFNGKNCYDGGFYVVNNGKIAV